MFYTRFSFLPYHVNYTEQIYFAFTFSCWYVSVESLSFVHPVSNRVLRNSRLFCAQLEVCDDTLVSGQQEVDSLHDEVKFAFLLNNHNAASKLILSLLKDSFRADLKKYRANNPPLAVDLAFK